MTLKNLTPEDIASARRLIEASAFDEGGSWTYINAMRIAFSELLDEHERLQTVLKQVQHNAFVDRYDANIVLKLYAIAEAAEKFLNSGQLIDPSNLMDGLKRAIKAWRDLGA